LIAPTGVHAKLMANAATAIESLCEDLMKNDNMAKPKQSIA